MFIEKISRKNRFLVAVFVQILILFLIIISKFLIIQSGVQIALKIVPVDPRDYLRGDYMTFSYDISRIDTKLFKDTVKRGQRVYVKVIQQGNFWIPAEASAHKPTADNSIFIKGRVKLAPIMRNLDSSESFLQPKQNSTEALIEYGIENYFIPEGKGQNFSFQNKEVSATVLVNESGDSVLKQVYVDGKVWP